MVYNKTVLSYPGQPWSKHQPVHCPVYSNMAGYPAKNNVIVPRQVVTHMQDIGNNWVVEFLTLKSLQ